MRYMSYVMLASHLKGAALKTSFTAAGRVGCLVVVRMRVSMGSSGDVTPVNHSNATHHQESKQMPGPLLPQLKSSVLICKTGMSKLEVNTPASVFPHSNHLPETKQGGNTHP